MQIRQGDVLLRKISEPARKQRLLDEQGHPLAGLRVDGEATGHAHVLRARVYQTARGNQVLFLERPTPMTHQEHRHVEVPAGWWEVVIQREFVPCERPSKPPRPRRRRD